MNSWRDCTVLHVVASRSRAGTEVACRNLAAGLARYHGIRNVIAALNPGDSSIAKEFAAVADSRLLPKGRMNLLRESQILARELKPQAAILHVFGVDQLVFATGLFAAGVDPILVVLGNPAPHWSVTRLKWSVLLRLSAFLRVVFVAVTQHVARSISLPATVIHHGCDVDATAGDAQAARSKRQKGPFVFGMVARLDRIKDHRTLLAAFAVVKQQDPDFACVLRIVGDGPLRAKLERQATDLGIAAHVEFTGARTDIARGLGEMDAFILSTTRDEGFGLVLIEALAAGVPVIASDVPACREVLADGRFGTLVKARDADALADAMRNAAKAQPQPIPRAEIESAYGLRAMADRYMRILNEART